MPPEGAGRGRAREVIVVAKSSSSSRAESRARVRAAGSTRSTTRPSRRTLWGCTSCRSSSRRTRSPSSPLSSSWRACPRSAGTRCRPCTRTSWCGPSAAGCGRMRRVAAGCGGLWLVAAGCGWLRRVAAVCGWLWLVAARCGWLRRVAAGCGALRLVATGLLRPGVPLVPASPTARPLALRFTAACRATRARHMRIVAARPLAGRAPARRDRPRRSLRGPRAPIAAHGDARGAGAVARQVNPATLDIRTREATEVRAVCFASFARGR